MDAAGEDRTRRRSNRREPQAPALPLLFHSLCSLRLFCLSHDIRPRSLRSRLQEELAPVLGCNPDISWSSLILIYTARAVVFSFFKKHFSSEERVDNLQQFILLIPHVCACVSQLQWLNLGPDWCQAKTGTLRYTITAVLLTLHRLTIELARPFLSSSSLRC